MSAHLATERLSAYLDQELEEHELRRVEAHVSECPHCQHRLRGLRRVVDELQRVPAVPAPAGLGRSLERESAARWRAHRERTRRLAGREGFDRLQDLVQLGAAMAVAAAIAALLLVHSAARRPEGSTRLVVPAGESAPAPGQRLTVQGRGFVLIDGIWWQEDLRREGEPAPEATPLAEREALVRLPWLPVLLRSAPVVVELDGAAVRVEPAPPAVPAEPADAAGAASH